MLAWTLVVFGAGLWAGGAVGQSRPKMWTTVLLRTGAENLPRNLAVQLNDDHWEPGAETGAHQHPGPTIIVVLEGELTEAAGTGTALLKAGQAVWRPARQEHNVRNAGGRPARALAVHLDPAQ
jgi:quercetin dioxygenase-like cupin family protein